MRRHDIHKKGLAFFVSLCLFLALFGRMERVQAAVTSGTDGEVSWQISGSTLTISAVPGTNGAMAGYSYATHAPWQQTDAFKKVKNVVIEDGVSAVGGLAFYGNDIHLESMSIAGSVYSIPEYFCKNIHIDRLYLGEGTRIVRKGAFLATVQTVYIPKSVEALPLSAFGINNEQGNGTISYVSHVYGYTDSAGQQYAQDYPRAVAATLESSTHAWTDARKYELDSNLDGIADPKPKIVFTALDKSSVLKKATVTSSVSMSVGKTQKLKVTVPSYLTLVTKYSGTEGEVKATYKSKNSKIATVDKNGKVTGKKKGTTTITTTLKLKNGTKKTFTTKVTVK